MLHSTTLKKDIPLPTAEQERTFWKTVKKEPTGCWTWQKPSLSLSAIVYGPWRTRTPRRFAFAAYYHRLPRHFVLTTCHNVACVNPAHLRDSNAPAFAAAPAFQDQHAATGPSRTSEWLNSTPMPAVQIPEVHDMPSARQVGFWLWAGAAVVLAAMSFLTPIDMGHWRIVASLVAVVVALFFK